METGPSTRDCRLAALVILMGVLAIASGILVPGATASTGGSVDWMEAPQWVDTATGKSPGVTASSTVKSDSRVRRWRFAVQRSPHQW